MTRGLPIYPYEETVCDCCGLDFERPRGYYGSYIKQCFRCRMRCSNQPDCQLRLAGELDSEARP